MSVATSSVDGLQKAQAWCDTAGGLVGKEKPKAWEYYDAAEELARIFANTKGRPPEISPDEWGEATAGVAKARSGRVGTSSPSPSKNAEPTQKRNFKEYEEEVEPIVARLQSSVDARKQKYAALDAEALTPFTQAGGKALKCSDDPAGMLARARLLESKMKAANKFPRVKPQIPEFLAKKEAKGHFDDFAVAIADLDLDEAETLLSLFEVLRDAAVKEQASVAALQKQYEGTADAPTDLEVWRKVNANDGKVAAIRAELPGIMGTARQVGQTNAGKRQQCDDFEPRIEKALKDWEGFSVTQKLRTSEKDVGSVAWFEDKIERLKAPPYATAAEGEAKILAMQWKAFEDDVKKGWDAFEKSKFKNKALRGPMGDPALRSWRVEQKLVEGAVFKIGGKNYTVSKSMTTGRSLKASIPKPPGGYLTNKENEEIAHYIYHLKETGV